MLNKRVEAWKGARKGDTGLVVRQDGIYHCYVRWDSDGAVESCNRGNLIAVEFAERNCGLRPPEPPEAAKAG